MIFESSAPSTNLSPNDEWWTPRLARPVIAAAAVRLALLAVSLARIGSSGIMQADTASYLGPGRNLLHGVFAAEGVPELLRTPGYPLFLALTSLAGLPAAAIANVILSVFSVIIVWRLGRAASGNDRIALCAAWIFAFEPVSVIQSVGLMSDTLFLTIFLLSLERLAEFLRGYRLWVLAVAGLWLAMATFVRPVSYYLPVALAVGLFVVLARIPGLRWKAPAVLLMSTLPWLAAWQIRNKIETGYGGFSSITDANLYFYSAAGVTARIEGRPFLEVRRELGYLGGPGYLQRAYLYPEYLALHPEQVGWSQGQRLAFMHSEALRVIRAHYGTYLRMGVTSLCLSAFDPSAGNLDHLLIQGDRVDKSGLVDKGPVRWAIVLIERYPWIAAEKMVFAAVVVGLYLFALRGVFRRGMNNSCVWLLLGVSIYFLAIAGAGGGPGADARYRLPITPVLCILAAAGAVRTKTISLKR